MMHRNIHIASKKNVTHVAGEICVNPIFNLPLEIINILGIIIIGLLGLFIVVLAG